MVGLNKACTKAPDRSQPVDDRLLWCIWASIILRIPPVVMKPYCAAIWLSSSRLSPSTCGVSLLIPPNHCLCNIIPENWCRPHDRPSISLADDQPHFWEGRLGFNTWRLCTQSTPSQIRNFRVAVTVLLSPFQHAPVTEICGLSACNVWPVQPATCQDIPLLR